MKTLIFLLSVNLALVVTAIPLTHGDSIQANLEKIIGLAEDYVRTLPEDFLKTLGKDLTHLTETTNKCKEFFCEVEAVLASLEHHFFGKRGEIVRSLEQYNKHMNCPNANHSQGNQVELKRLLHDLKGCGQKINSNKV
uniref:Interleukin-4 n=1 Tax=Esox lucius TaxID=8010 RepID=A0A3P9AMG5_ESOLU